MVEETSSHDWWLWGLQEQALSEITESALPDYVKRCVVISLAANRSTASEEIKSGEENAPRTPTGTSGARKHDDGTQKSLP